MDADDPDLRYAAALIASRLGITAHELAEEMLVPVQYAEQLLDAIRSARGAS